MQLYSIRLQKSQNIEHKLSVSPDYTFYQIKKEASKIYNHNSTQFDIQLDGFRVNDLKLKISQFTISDESVLQIVQKVPFRSSSSKIYFNITWQDVSYTVSVNSNSLIFELKNKMVEMLGLSGLFSMKYDNNELDLNEPAINYLYSSKLSLERVTMTLNREIKQVESIKSSSQKENNNIKFNAKGNTNFLNKYQEQLNKNKKKILMKFNSLKQLIQDSVQDSLQSQFYAPHKLVRNISMQHQQQSQLSNTQNYFKPKYIQNLTKFQIIQSEAKSTLSMNSSNQDEPTFQHISIFLQNHEQSRIYTIECLKDIRMSNVREKLGVLERIKPQRIALLFNNQLSQNKMIDVNRKLLDITNGQKSCKIKYIIKTEQQQKFK